MTVKQFTREELLNEYSSRQLSRKGNFYLFCQQAWPILEPGTPLVWSWHMDAMCAYLEAYAYGDIRRLIINVPPGPGWVENMVNTDKGRVRLGDIKVGDNVLTHKGRYKRVTACHPKGMLNCLKITTNSGRSMHLTPEHNCLTPDGWVPAGNLVVGDNLAVVNPCKTEDCITSIEESGMKECMCISVEDDHSLTWNDLVVHNSGKSLLVSVFMPAWVWTWDSSKRFINLTNEVGLAARDSRRMRDLILSDWYKARWGSSVILSADQKEKLNFELTTSQDGKSGRGFRIGLGMSGNISGKRGNCLVAGTLVDTVSGKKKIEDIRVGDIVASVEDSRIMWNKVSARQFSLSEEIYEITTVAGNKIRLTGGHKVYSEGWVAARDLRKGCEIRSMQSHNTLEEDTILSIKRVGGGKEYVYDIQVERANNFFAGSILVHNSLIIDDPIDTKKAFSDVEIQSVNDTYDQAVSSRLNDFNTDGIVLIMQRTRTNDLTGHLMSKKDQHWVLMKIPMEGTSVPGYNPLNDIGLLKYGESEDISDNRKIGELMFPERFSAETVKALKEDLSEYGVAGQLQQRPTPLGGGIIKKSYWEWWPENDPLPTCEHLFISWDTAYTEADSKTSSYSAATVWGIFWHTKRGRWCMMVVKRWFGRVSYPMLRKIAQDLTEDLEPDCHLIEKKASGISLLQDLKRAGSGKRRVRLRAYMPDRDKVSRAYTATATMAQGLVYAPVRKWASELIDYCAEFPAGAPPSSDLTDTVTQAILYLKNGWWIEHPDDKDPDNVMLEDWKTEEENEDEITYQGGMYG